jgi:hypothetical protein
MTEIKSNLQKNKEYDELDRFLKLPFSLPQCHQNNKNAHKRKADTNATFTEFSDFRHFEKKLHIAESKLEISCNIIFTLRFSDSTVSSFCVSSFSFFISAFCSLITFL